MKSELFSWTAVTACCGLALAVSGCARESSAPAQTEYSVEEKPLADLQSDLSAGRVTSQKLVELYLARIRDLDQSGPALRSVLAVNPRAADDARRLDDNPGNVHVGAEHGNRRRLHGSEHRCEQMLRFGVVRHKRCG